MAVFEFSEAVTLLRIRGTSYLIKPFLVQDDFLGEAGG